MIVSLSSNGITSGWYALELGVRPSCDVVHRLRHQQIFVSQRVRRPGPLLNLIRHIQTQRRIRPERQLLKLARHVALLSLRKPLITTNVLELAPVVGLLVCGELEGSILLKHLQLFALVLGRYPDGRSWVVGVDVSADGLRFAEKTLLPSSHELLVLLLVLLAGGKEECGRGSRGESALCAEGRCGPLTHCRLEGGRGIDCPRRARYPAHWGGHVVMDVVQVATAMFEMFDFDAAPLTNQECGTSAVTCMVLLGDHHDQELESSRLMIPKVSRFQLTKEIFVFP